MLLDSLQGIKGHLLGHLFHESLGVTCSLGAGVPALLKGELGTDTDCDRAFYGQT